MREEEEEEEEVSLVLQEADRQSSQMENLLELFPFDHSPKRAVKGKNVIQKKMFRHEVYGRFIGGSRKMFKGWILLHV